MSFVAQYDALPPAPKPPLVIYHYPCLDGFTAAWACWLKYPNAEFVHGVHGQPPPDVTGRDVIILDFSYKRPIMLEITKQAKSVLILDHHKSAAEDLSGLDTLLELNDNVNVVFNMDKSGARLAWEYFHPPVLDSGYYYSGESLTEQKRPMLIDYVEDRDLWKFKYKETRAITATLFSLEYDFATWSAMSKILDTEEDVKVAILQGIAIERKHHKDIAELLKITRSGWEFSRALHLYPNRDANGKWLYIPTANMPYTMASDAANLMAEGQPFAATYYINSEEECVFSLRSKEGGVDVSEVAKLYGGGGHKHAAGFKLESIEDL